MKLLSYSLITLLFLTYHSICQTKIFVSKNAKQNGNGTFAKPFHTLELALNRAKKLANQDVTIEIHGGDYYFERSIVLSSNEAQFKSLKITAFQNEKVNLIGAKPITANWKNFQNNIWQAQINLDEPPDRIYLNGKTLRMARYPNFDENRKPFNGTAEDAINSTRTSFWKNFQNVYVHGLQNYRWGSLHYISKGKDANGNLILEGGWQINRESKLHDQMRFVENVFEELDAPSEWFYDAKSKVLYLIPPNGIDLQKAKLTIGTLSELFILRGNIEKPIKNVTIQNLNFTETNRTFMLTREPMLRSDWRIYRGGAILLEGAENVKILDCDFHELGGNAIFLSNYNKNNLIKNNHLFNLGASGILFVGNPNGVRSPAFEYGQVLSLNEIDLITGAKNSDYPQNCVAEGNLIHHIGMVEKQTAGVDIDMAEGITVSHNTIYHTPRAGINIGGGTWGGHLIVNNEVFETVLETGDNGAFNSWGRDRFWQPDRNQIDKVVAEKKGIELLDVTKPIIIRNNRFSCDHGWDIDLDDGSTNYQIYNNVLLNGGLKLREGYHRNVFNNILINNTLHPHVWLKNSGDSFERNIVTISYAPVLNENWGKSINNNFFLSKKSLDSSKTDKLDTNSQAGDGDFINPKLGNFQIKPMSKAFKVGFKNFPMNFGVTLERLQRIAKKPQIPVLLTEFEEKISQSLIWQGATIKNVETLGEQSAFGLSETKGVLFLDVPADSLAQKNGFKKGDVLLKFWEVSINNIFDLLQEFQKVKWQGSASAIIYRNQSELKLQLRLSD
ncbi:MAG TPA: PDZ domain-containing protein [Pyrinomonadaceae bacterium]|nr:PDZ domain-containing protein [Pyrinomonadaceae bacterium]